MGEGGCGVGFCAPAMRNEDALPGAEGELLPESQTDGGHKWDVCDQGQGQDLGPPQRQGPRHGLHTLAPGMDYIPWPQTWITYLGPRDGLLAQLG